MKKSFLSIETSLNRIFLVLHIRDNLISNSKVLENSIGKKKGKRMKKQGRWFDIFDPDIKYLKQKATNILKKIKNANEDEKIILRKRYSFLKREVKRILK